MNFGSQSKMYSELKYNKIDGPNAFIILVRKNET